jgi:predicted metalloendopeptidase
MNSNTLSRKRAATGVLSACLLAGALPGALAAQTAAPQAAAGPGGGGNGIELANFDTSVRPQDDFFRYVNGSWLRNTPIPSDRSNFGSFIELRDRSEEALRQLIEDAARQQNRPGSDAQKAADFYLAYMDSARIEQQGIRPLQGEISRIASLRDKGQLPAQWAHMTRIGVGTPISGYIGQDAKNATEYVVSVGQSGLGLPDRDYYFNQGAKFEQTRQAYQAYIETMMRLAGQPDPAGAARNIVALETRIAQSHWERARTRDREATYNRKSVAELNAMTPGFSWTAFLNAAGTQKTPAVVVRQPDYFQALDRTIAEVPMETWKQYMTFKLLNAYADELPRAFVDAKFNFTGRVLQGQDQNRPRWKRAVGATDGAMGELLGRMYVERNFRPEAKARMQALVTNLLAAFREGIGQLEWMSPETKAQALDKLAHFNVKIGYPDKWTDYSSLQVRRDDAVGNEMRANEFDFARDAAKLGKPIDRSEWGMTPQTVNAYYSSTMNEIVFPAAILQPPFFNMEADDAVNYGAIGAVIGHEISHGFDDQGRRSDGSGNLRDWWTQADAGAFDQRATALADQYSAYTPVEGTNINGRLTLGENIGDLSGLAVAYRAYKRSLNGREDATIGGFTGDQRFFIGWGQIWRSKYKDEALRNQLLTDPHSPGEYRTNAVLKNNPEFYAAFGVKEGDKMYLPPEQRVKIW